MRKITSLIAVLLLFSTLAFSQGRRLTGQVRDDRGTSVSFATVTETNTKNAVTADVNGNFTITISGNQITISAAGYEPQTITVSGDVVSITLVSGGQLREVVVTALGIRRTRNQVPYAAQQVAGDEVSKTRTSNFVQNLSGKVSGLELRQSNSLGGSTNVVIRGTKTISSGNQALFVVDGVPIDNSTQNSANQRTGRGGYDYGSAAADINPDDIESITVLKGAAATALYGSRGGNGVIIITTKRSSKTLGITVNSSVGFGKYDKSTFAKFQNEYGGGYGTYYEDPSGYFLYRDIDGNGTPDLVTPVSEDASYGGPFNPATMVFQWDAFDPNSPNFGKAKPWVAAANDPGSMFQTQVSSNQSIMVDGGSDKGSFKLGYTRTDERGIMPNSKITKNLVNFGGTFNVTSKLIAGASINFSGIEGRGRYGTGYDDKNLMTNFRQWWQTNVDIEEQKTAYFNERRNVTWNWADPTDLVPIYWDNPFFTRYENFQTDNRQRFFGNVNLNFSPVSWVNILGRVSQDQYDELAEERQAVGSVTTSSYSRVNRNVRETNFDLMANFDRDINEDFNFKGLLGTNVRKERRQGIAASTNGGLIVERIYALSNSASSINPPAEADVRREVWGNFGGVTLTFKDMLTLDGTVRNDRSSTLPEGANSYWYPSASMGFTFSKLVPEATWLSYGKIRANYAQVGNDAPAYAIFDTYIIGVPFGPSPVSSVSGAAANPTLRPERTKSYEFGLEAAFMKNRFGFDITYYNAKTFDQIFPVPVSTSTGYDSKFLNAGNIRNKGVELSIFAAPVQTRDFTWNVNLNWTRNRNKVEELTEGVDNIVLGTFQGGVSLNATLDQPYGTIRGSDYIYTNGQKTVGANGLYLRTATSNIVLGDANPDWIGGLNNSLKYKNFGFSFLIDTRQGGDLFSLDMYYGLATGIYPETAGKNDLGNQQRLPIAQGGGVILPGVDATGKVNDIRVEAQNYGLYGYARHPNMGFVYDASFIKLREAILSFGIPSTTLSGVKFIKGIDLSLIGRNLWIIDKELPYSDPEEIISAGNLQGYQGGAYPAVRTFTFNVKFKF